MEKGAANNLVEFIGFLISLVVIIYLFIKRIREEQRRRAHPEEWQAEQRRQKEAYRAFLKEMNIDVAEDEPEEEVRTPIRGAMVEEQRAVMAPYQVKLAEPIRVRAAPSSSLIEKEPEERHAIIRALHQRHELQRAILLREIIGPPKGLIR